MEFVTLYVTTSDRDEGVRIARTLVEERLAACGNLIEGMTSLYRWEGAMQQASETVLLLKTRADLIQAATDRIRALHSYDCPCVTAWPIVAGNPAYLDWVRDETASAVPPGDSSQTLC